MSEPTKAEIIKALEAFARRTASEEYINDPATPDDGWCASQSYTAGDYRRVRFVLARLKEAGS